MHDPYREQLDVCENARMAPHRGVFAHGRDNLAIRAKLGFRSGK